MIAMNYGHVYVAQVSMGANPAHVVKALKEAEAHKGRPSSSLTPLHQPRHRQEHEGEPGGAEAGGGVRLLAPVPVQP